MSVKGAVGHLIFSIRAPNSELTWLTAWARDTPLPVHLLTEPLKTESALIQVRPDLVFEMNPLPPHY